MFPYGNTGDYNGGMSKALNATRIGGDARGEPRRVWQRNAQVSVAGGIAVLGKTMDISASGISVMTENPIPIGSSCSLRVTFLLGETISRLEVHGKSVYCVLVGTQGYRTGIQFGSLDSANRALVHRIVES